MILFSALIGAAIGAFTAYRRKGNRLDMLHYAAGYGIAFGLVGAVLSIALVRLQV
ncbi:MULTISPECIES: apolipoprotein acyltransferase [unclassified Rhodosalinus]|uniref:apolipoprotein acyltransferase n=1 Tax=unclassified Rhodosalinus TaxID=2630183 RepID=UPI0035249DF4